MPDDFVIGPIAELHTLAGGACLRRGPQLNATGRIRNAAVAVLGGMIAEVGPAEDILREYNLPNIPARLVTPGLVDAHTHLVWAGSRADEFIRRSNGESYESIAAAGGGILSTMAATRASDLQTLKQNLEQRAHRIAQMGTTTIEAKASYGLARDACEKELDAIANVQTKARLVPTFMGAHAFPPDFSHDEFMDIVCSELIPMASSHSANPKFCDVFCEIGAFSVEEAERVLRAGIAHGLKPKLHADEFNDLGGVQMACSIGAASCDHLLVTGPAGRQALAESDTAAVLMPGTSLYLGKPYANGRALVDAGCAVALGTDFNPGSSMVCSMPLTIGLGVSKLGLTPEEALSAATVNASAAIGVDSGRIEPGMPADICLWPCDSLAEFVWQYTFIAPDAVFIGGEALE